MPISIPAPQLQIDFAFALEQIRGLYLQHALSEAVGKLDIKNVDAELARIVPSASLTQLVTCGLRGELQFLSCFVRDSAVTTGRATYVKLGQTD